MNKALALVACTAGWFFSLTAQPDITTQDIEGASRLIGIEFTGEEIDSLHKNLLGNLDDFKRNRDVSLDNSVSPALYFNPLPPGFNVPEGPRSTDFRTAPCELPNDLSELAFYSIPQLAYLVQNRMITSLELTEFFLERLLEHDKTLHCVITYTRDRAMAQARLMDDELASGKVRGLLHGIPYGIKDLFAVAGYPTTWGAAPYKDQEFDYDADIVKKLDEAGAVLIAKLTLGALAWGDVWYGEQTRNPWNPERGSSGSSAGSASAVSAGLVPFAIGTETLGSIVSPSTVCGTTGLRPTFGRVSRSGAMALSWSMDKIGPICRSAYDCAIVFDALTTPFELDQVPVQDQSVIEASFRYTHAGSVDGLKVGFVKSHFARDYAFHDNDSIALATLLNQGIELHPIELPDYPNITFLLSVEAATAFDELTRTGQDDLLVRQIRNAWPNVLRAARFVPAVEYIQAQRLRTILIAEMDKIFRGTRHHNPSLLGQLSMLAITNMTGHPTVVVPNGLHEGTPTSISFTGRLFEEGDVLRFAQFFQEISAWDEMRPNGF